MTSIKFKGIEVVQSERHSFGNVPFWVDINDDPRIKTVYDPTTPGFEENYWYDLNHERGHVLTFYPGGNKKVLKKMRDLLPLKKTELVHKFALRELEADMYATMACKDLELRRRYISHVRKPAYSYDHNMARRLFLNIMNTGRVFGPETDITQLEGEFAIVGGLDVGKSRMVNYLIGVNVARVVDFRDNKPTEDVTKYQRGNLVLWDTPPIDTIPLDDTGELGRLQTKTMKFLQEHPDIPVIYAVSTQLTAREAQALAPEKLRIKVKQLVMTKGDNPTSMDSPFIAEYGTKFPVDPVVTSVVTGEGFHYLIENLMGRRYPAGDHLYLTE